MWKLLNKYSTQAYENIRSRYYRTNLSYRYIHTDQLPNGVKIAIEELGTPLSCTSMVIQTGPRFENNCNNGLTNFIEHVLLSSKNLQEILYSKGIKIKSITTRDFQRFSAICPSERATDALEILYQIISTLELSDTEIESQKKLTLTEAIDCDNNPELLVFDYLHQTAFQGTSLGQNVIGPKRNIEKFNKDFICNFMEENYQPHRILLISSGDVSRSSIMCKLNSTLGMIPCPERKTIDFGQQRYTGSSIIYRNDSLPYAHVAIAYEAPGLSSGEYLPLLVASCLTGSWNRTQGGTDRHSSPLVRAAATSKLCEKFESFYIAYEDVGLWGVYFVGVRNDLDDMVVNIQEQWMNMCTTVVNSEVERAINITKLKLAKRVDGAVNSCHDIGTQLLYTSKRKSLCDLYDELSLITEKTIKDICFKYIYDKCPVVAAVGPTETLPHYNRIRSGSYWLRF